MNDELTNEEMIKTIEEFAKTNPDDYEYILLLSQGYYGWAELSSGKTVYISPPRTSGEEIGESFKKIFSRTKNENINKLNELGIYTANKTISEVLGELATEWNLLNNK